MITDLSDFERDTAIRRAYRHLLKRDIPPHIPSFATTLTLPGIHPFRKTKKSIGCFLSRLQHHLETRIAAIGIIVRGEVSMHCHMILIAADYSERLKLIAIPDIERIIRDEWRRFMGRANLEVHEDAIFDLGGYCTYLTRPRNLDLTGDRSYIFWHNPRLLERIRALKPRKPSTPK